ncbi:hypothetical protein BDY19DRAFT_291995 [Irpex rosettiformis]|uniref:Uncharacterized protein n=1 Tax=Irpex rosettiformis TaxID=378272 RepID=A0ACB8UID7_9APHY|nr:hypothetical protein BDY19DRAFT_291995 [Irpex rosettiformis]
MRPSLISTAVLPLSLWSLVAARLHHLVPEDPYAFPKYRVAFLNGLPLLNDTAQRWLQSGLEGGELEFLDQPWREDAQWRIPPIKGIEGGSQQDGPAETELDASPCYKLELMKIGPRVNYLCLIPPPPPENISVPVEEPTAEITPVHSWSLLQPLSGGCLYHRQGWFTYAYCHNSHVRQFHELLRPNQQRLGKNAFSAYLFSCHATNISLNIGEYKPEEDTEWEAYTLGRAPPTPEAGADLTVAQEAAIAANVELARKAGSRYLVQRWGDGTFCEKIGRRREIEIQFHCSMTMTDSILFVKETQTCHYVLHIATPRLCSEPGFRSRLDSHQETYIRCREIVSPEEYETIDRDLPERDYPIKMKSTRGTRKEGTALPLPAGEVGEAASGGRDEKSNADSVVEKLKEELKSKQNELLKKALEKIVAGEELGRAGEFVFEDGDGSMVAFIEVPEDLEGDLAGASLEDILRAVGYDVKSKDVAPEKDNDGEKKEEKKAQRKDEL